MESELKKCRKELLAVKSDMNKLQENFKKEVKRAGARAMVEFKELKEKVDTLREEKRRLQDQIESLLRKNPPSKKRNVDDTSFKSAGQQSQKNSLLKALRQFDDNIVRPRGKSNEPSTTRSCNNPRKNVDMTKYSSSAARQAKKI